MVQEKKSDPDDEATAPAAAATFREKVEEFWRWWSANSQRILDSVEGDGGESIQPEISAAVDRLGDSYGWVFGPPPDGVPGHSFTLSPEGCTTQRYLTRYWHSRAPDLEGWTFFSARQPSTDFGGAVIRMGETNVEAQSVWITPVTDADRQLIDITAWSPTFSEIGEDHAMRILFLFLDEALGEELTERCLGAIDVSDARLEDSIPLTELNQHVLDVFAKNEWRILDTPWSGYKVDESLGDFPRGDVFVGSTENWPLVRDWIREAGPVENPVPGSGADLVFLQLARSLFPEGGEVEYRTAIMDSLDERLLPDLGRVTGGAMGNDAGYIDLILIDGPRSREAIEEVLGGRGLKGQYQLFSFVK